MDKAIAEFAAHQASLINKLLAENAMLKQNRGGTTIDGDWHIDNTGPNGAVQYTIQEPEPVVKEEPPEDIV